MKKTLSPAQVDNRNSLFRARARKWRNRGRLLRASNPRTLTPAPRPHLDPPDTEFDRVVELLEPLRAEADRIAAPIMAEAERVWADLESDMGDPPKSEPLAEDVVGDVAEQIADSDGMNLPVLSKKMGGHVSVLVFFNGEDDIKGSELFWVQDGVATARKNTMRGRKPEDFGKGWVKGAIIKFPEITLLRAQETLGIKE